MAKKVLNLREIQAKTGLNLVGTYLTLFVVNGLVLWLGNLLFPTAVVLGTATHSYSLALLLSTGKLTLIATAVMPFVALREWQTGHDFTPRDWMTLYFVVNTLAVWLLGRLATTFGLGISSWWIAILMGAALDWAQGMAMMAYGKVTGQQT